MKKIKYLIMAIVLIPLTGCFNNDSMDNIKISTSVYPIEYVTKTLYGEHSEISSIYPIDSEATNFKITKTALKQYSENDMFIFNGLSNEKDYIKTMAKHNKNIKIIDVTSNMQITNSMEELWLDPNKLLTIANNIKKGFREYIKSTYLVNEVKENYENLKINLTSLDGKYYQTVKKASNKNIIVSDDAFKYLEKYGVNVISLDSDTVTQKDIIDAENLLRNGCSYIFIKYGETTNDTVNDLINKTSATKQELYTMTNLENVDTDKTDYIVLMNQNLESLKLELYK